MPTLRLIGEGNKTVCHPDAVSLVYCTLASNACVVAFQSRPVCAPVSEVALKNRRPWRAPEIFIVNSSPISKTVPPIALDNSTGVVDCNSVA